MLELPNSVSSHHGNASVSNCNSITADKKIENLVQKAEVILKRPYGSYRTKKCHNRKKKKVAWMGLNKRMEMTEDGINELEDRKSIFSSNLSNRGNRLNKKKMNRAQSTELVHFLLL